MYDFESQHVENPVAYAARTGDNSRGVTLEQVLPASPASEPYSDERHDASGNGTRSALDLVVPLIVSAVFLLIALSSF
ncbi:MAG: hypothetical protein AAF683_00405 [Pseudomonadota bacterium]